MSGTNFLERAITTVKKAVESDTAGEYEKAYQLYYQALELFMLVLKYEKNARQKQMIQEKAKEYMERAEKLKKHLADQESKDKKGPAAIGANGKASGGSGKKCVGFSIYRCYAKHTDNYSLFTIETMKTTTRNQRSFATH